MAKYVDQERLLKSIEILMRKEEEEKYIVSASNALRYMDGLIKTMDTSDVVPVVHGWWIVTKEYNDVIGLDVVKYTCSACGEYRLTATTLSQATNYCPNCGAKMDAEG